MRTLAEAVRATGQPCTFLLLAPTLLAVAALRAAWWAVGAAFAAAIVGGWLLAANVFVLDGWLLQVSGVVVAALVGVAVVRPSGSEHASAASHATTASIAATITLVASSWWRPCVGEQLGTLLTAAQTEPITPLPGLAVYMVGAMLPVLVVALAWRAVAPPARVERIARLAAAGATCFIALAVAAGQHDAVVVALTRWTTTA